MIFLLSRGFLAASSPGRGSFGGGISARIPEPPATATTPSSAMDKDLIAYLDLRFRETSMQIESLREQNAQRFEQIDSRFEQIDRRFEQMADVLNHDLLNPHERKAHIKAKKKEYKQRTKEQKKGKTARSRIFVLDFDGDIRASAVEHLREEISAVVQVARPEDEVLLRLESRAAWSIRTAWQHRNCAG